MIAWPLPRRSWFKFSLRALMLFTLACACAAGWFSHRYRQKLKERDAVAAIVALGGHARYDYESTNAEPTGPTWLRRWLGDNFFNDVEEINLSGARETDHALEIIRGISGLKTLILQETAVTDHGLANLSEFTELHDLNLVKTDVGDAGLAHLTGLTRLQRLFLSKTKISDAGLENLEGLTRLQLLSVADTSVTDSAIRGLQNKLYQCCIYPVGRQDPPASGTSGH